MASCSTERWAFLADWQDPNSGVRWTYQLFAYLVPDAHVEVEMVSLTLSVAEHETWSNRL